MADKRLRPVDRDAERKRMEDFFAQFSEGQISLADAVKEMRRISRLTQPEFAKHRNISLGTLRQIESGEADPRVATLNKIANIFGLEIGFVKKPSSRNSTGSP